MIKPDNPTLIRLIVALALAGAALSMFLMTRGAITSIQRSKEIIASSLILDIDREVDSVFAHFNIEKGWVKKSSVPLPNTTSYRIERRVMIPPDVLPVQMNSALNAMAKRYNGRAVASENLKENLVTIHIETQGIIVQTIILKTKHDLKRARRNEGQTKI
jgi:hypothetical protein